MLCPGCGREIYGEKCCPKCGRASMMGLRGCTSAHFLEELGVVRKKTPFAGKTNAPAKTRSNAQHRAKKKSSGIGILALLLALCVAALVFLVANGAFSVDKQPTAEEKKPEEAMPTQSSAQQEKEEDEPSAQNDAAAKPADILPPANGENAPVVPESTIFSEVAPVSGDMVLMWGSEDETSLGGENGAGPFYTQSAEDSAAQPRGEN